MPVRDRIAGGLTRLAKRFGTAIPEPYLEGEAASGMTPATPFGPGTPLAPYDGFGRTPRAHEFVPQYNVSARPRSHERIAFSTLRGLIDAYDFAQICIWHRIDSIRSLERSLVAADGYEGDVTDAVKIGEAFLKKPDRETPWDAWLAEYLYDVLAYDAGSLSRMRDRLGRTVGLRTVDGTTLAPLLDDWGNTPQYPAEAYIQYVNGLPWNWLTDRDLIYRPFRKRSNSPYGSAPMESLLLNANTDLRFQAYFLQRFTEGNIPRAFASAPESWTPDQIEQFQQAWDALMRGDQEILSQIKWIPGGGAIAWSDEKDFSDTFSLFMMRKTAAGYHVVPADLGFTETVNRSTGETQSDVQHRLGDTPLAKHVDGIITAVLQDDLGLPIQHKFDLGEEQDDRLQTAQADFIYWRMAAVGTSEIRAMRYGLTEPEGKPVPRTFFTERAGPIPLSALDAVAGPVDQLTGAPAPGAPPPEREFLPIEGTLPNPPPDAPPLAEQIYGPGAVAGIPQPPDVAKDAAPAAGITAATGVYGFDLVGHDEEEDDDEPATPYVVKAARERAAELGAFRAYVRKSRRTGRPWRDFQFTTLDPAAAALNTEARDSIAPSLAKDATGTPGLTKRSGMISLDLEPGTIPTVPGGVTDHHITVVYLGKDVDDAAFAQACARAGSAAASVPGPIRGTVAGVDCFEPSAGSDGLTPAFAPVDLPGAHDLRAALGDLSASEHTDYHPHVTLAYLRPGDQLPEPVPNTPVAFTHLSVHRGPDVVRIPLGPAGGAQVAKGGDPGPKAQPPAEGEPVQQAWPGWQYDLAAAAYWSPLIAAALAAALRPEDLARAYLAEHSDADVSAEGETKAETAKRLTTEAQAWARTERAAVEQALTQVLPGLYTDGYLIGAASAKAVVEAVEAGTPLAEAVADVGAWVVGDTEAAQLLLGELGDGAGLRALLDQADITIKSVADSRLDELGRTLAEGAARGDSADTIARAIKDVLANPARAHMIATTELCRAVSAATAQEYGKRGVEHVNWSTAYDDRVCVRCDANEAVGEHPLGEPFPSGAAYPPQHPMCRCALLPSAFEEA